MIEKFYWLEIGKCYQLEKFAQSKGKWCECEFPAGVAVFQDHVLGWCLYDTGYLNKNKWLSSYPNKIYDKFTKVSVNDDELITKLQFIGLEVADIKYVFISHFHPDHVGNLYLFTEATIVCDIEDWKSLSSQSLIQRVHNLFIKELADINLFQSKRHILNFDITNKSFFNQHAVTEDHSIIIVPLPGHTKKHYGLVLHYRDYYLWLIGDACWRTENYIDLSYPHWLTRLVHYDFKLYKDNIRLIHELSKDKKNIILPSHASDNVSKLKVFNQ